MEHIEKILQKLRKLMNLKESATALGNTGEANAAAAGITRLLMEYNLSEKDIPEQEKIENPIIAEEIPYRSKFEQGKWYSYLVEIVCKYNMCRMLVVSERKPSTGKLSRSNFEIIGRKKNVEVVLYLISFLAFQFVSIGRTQYPTYRMDCIRKRGQLPLTEKKFLKSFLIGCVIGLEDKFLKDRSETINAETVKALTLSSETEIDDFLSGEEIGHTRSYQPAIDKLAAKQGLKIGMNININKAIYADTVLDERLID